MSKTILLVDDDADFVAEVQPQLAAAGYNVVTAETAADAEAKFGQTKPDLVITELLLEHADSGFSMCYHMKKADADMPIILVTGVASETGIDFDAATAEERSWVKADVALAKPVRFEQLHREIHRLLKD